MPTWGGLRTWKLLSGQCGRTKKLSPATSVTSSLVFGSDSITAESVELQFVVSAQSTLCRCLSLRTTAESESVLAVLKKCTRQASSKKCLPHSRLNRIQTQLVSQANQSYTRSTWMVPTFSKVWSTVALEYSSLKTSPLSRCASTQLP